MKTVRKECVPAWFGLLCPRVLAAHAMLAPMEGDGPAGPADVATPWQDQLQLLCEEFADVFERPGPAPDRPITHSIDLQDEAAAPPKPRLYRMSPAELAEVRK